MLHTLSGLPRSGTTLIANVLAQHPDVAVSGTSPLCAVIEGIAGELSRNPEVQAELAHDPATYARYVGAVRAFVEAWHADRGRRIVIDKSRGWVAHRILLDQVLPRSVSVVVARDPRDVIASIERHHRRSGLFDSPLARTVYEMADVALAPAGMVGGALRFAEDLIRRNLASVEWVRYETFVLDPLETLARLERRLGLDAGGGGWCWNLEDVANVAPDLDALHRGKYPHDASGAICPPGTTWRDTLDPDLARRIAGVAPLYMATFGYGST